MIFSQARFLSSPYMRRCRPKSRSPSSRESDIYRRAVLLSEFSQRYPKSPLLQPEDREILKRYEKGYDAYYMIQREADIENRAAMRIGINKVYTKAKELLAE